MQPELMARSQTTRRDTAILSLAAVRFENQIGGSAEWLFQFIGSRGPNTDAVPPPRRRDGAVESDPDGGRTDPADDFLGLDQVEHMLDIDRPASGRDREHPRGHRESSAIDGDDCVPKHLGYHRSTRVD